MRGGQSLSAGSQPPYVDNAPGELQLLLQGKYWTTAATVWNDGVPGATLHDELNGLAPYYTKSLQQRLAADPSQIVIENFGINDASRTDPATFKSDLNAWIDAVRAAGKTPVLEEPNPICTDDATKLQPLVVIVDQVAIAKGVPLVQQYAYISGMDGWQSMLVDCVHPEAALYKLKAEREYAIVQPIVDGLLK